MITLKNLKSFENGFNHFFRFQKFAYYDQDPTFMMAESDYNRNKTVPVIKCVQFCRFFVNIKSYK
jgi:hypothetical protein